MESARVVLVTNVGQGFGRAVALSYGHAGFDVVCADPDVDLASKTAAEVEEVGGQAIPVQADMTSLLDVRSTFAKVFEIFGVLGGVVHVVSQESQSRFAELSESEFAELLREDVTSTFLLLRTAERLLRSGWVVVVAPTNDPEYPQMAGVQGAITGVVSALANAPERSPFPEIAIRASDVSDPEPPGERPRINVVVPSRTASDPRSDAALVHAVRYLGSAAAQGLRGTVVPVQLPPPPKVIETLLPEVQAALDDTVRQGDLDDDAALPYEAPSQAQDDDVLREAGLDDQTLALAAAGIARLEEDAYEAAAREESTSDRAVVVRQRAPHKGGWQR